MIASGNGSGEDNRPADQFLVDGVAPSVIGGESGGDLDVDYGGDPGGDIGGEYEPRVRREPPTTPIPAQQPDEPRRKTWLGRMFGR